MGIESFKVAQDQSSIVPNTSAYSAQNLVGGLLTWSLPAITGKSGITIRDVLLRLKGTVTANMAVVLFDANPSATTFTDKAALTIAAADLAHVIAYIPITQAIALAANSLEEANNLDIRAFALGPAATATALGAPQDPAAAAITQIWGCLITTGTPTFAAAGTIDVVLGGQYDQA